MKKIEDYLHLYLGCQFCLRIPDGTLSGPMNFNVTALAASYSIKDNIQPLLLLRKLDYISSEETESMLSSLPIIENDVPHAFKLRSAQVTKAYLAMGVDLFGLIEAGLVIDILKYKL